MIRDISQRLQAKACRVGRTIPYSIFAAPGRWRRGFPVNVSALTVSSHAGTHADAPLHYDSAGARSTPSRSMPYLSPAEVVDGRGHDRLIQDRIIPRIASTAPRISRTYDRAPLKTWGLHTRDRPALIGRWPRAARF